MKKPWSELFTVSTRTTMDKWTTICIIGFVVAMVAPLAISEHSKNQCKIAYAQSSKTVQEIAEVCK